MFRRVDVKQDYQYNPASSLLPLVYQKGRGGRNLVEKTKGQRHHPASPRLDKEALELDLIQRFTKRLETSRLETQYANN
jgi:hypothetical protein